MWSGEVVPSDSAAECRFCATAELDPAIEILSRGLAILFTVGVEGTDWLPSSLSAAGAGRDFRARKDGLKTQLALALRHRTQLLTPFLLHRSL